jgi:L-ascorbate metabolism protein UlaG (beta-lactamase superfamily)
MSPEPFPSNLRFLGHSTVLIGLDGLRILTDPVHRGIGPLQRHGPVDDAPIGAIDVVVISHAHHDHLDLPTLRTLSDTPLIVTPLGTGGMLHRAGLQRIVEVRAGDVVDVGSGVLIEAVPALHEGYRRPFGPRAPALGFVIGGSSRVYFAGDTDIFPAMADFTDIDAALLPVWGWGPNIGPGHLDPARAATAAGMVGARVSVPIHWGSLFPMGMHRVWPDRLVRPPLDFAELVAVQGIDTEARILQPGDITVIEPRPSRAELG